MYNYNTFSSSVIGESHIRKNIVCQDYSGHIDTEFVKIAVVSDGHGDSACFRSNKGSQFAVEACLKGLLELADELESGNFNPEDLNINKKSADFKMQFAKGVIGEWNLLVQRDINNNPVNEEIKALKADENCSIDDITLNKYEKEEEINHIYGATLIAVMIVGDFLIAMQQGDGKCILMDRSGNFSEPIPWDDRCYMNITTSLCDDDAAQSFRFYISRLDDVNRPAGIFVASDGIEDSYDNNDAMFCFYRMLCIEMAKNGIEETSEKLKNGLLSDLSREGSADDISIAGIIDIESIMPLVENMEMENEICTINEAIRDAEERKKSMEAKKEYLERTCGAAWNELQELERKLAENKNKVSSLNAEINNNSIKIAQKKEEKVKLKHRLERMDFIQEKISKERKKYNALKKYIADCESKNALLETQVNMTSKDISKINCSITDKNEEFNKLNSEKKDYFKVYNELSERLNELFDEKNRLQGSENV